MNDTQIRDEWKLEIVCEFDDKLSPLDIDVARGIRDASELPRERYRQPDVEGPLEVVVIYMGDVVVFMTDESAWSGDLDDQDILLELVEDGSLIRDK